MKRELRSREGIRLRNVRRRRHRSNVGADCVGGAMRLVMDGVPPEPPSLVEPEKSGNAASEERDARVAWFRHARYGLFIHWGLYAGPAGSWKGVEYPEIGEWIMKWASIPVAEYRELAAQFRGDRFDAEEIVSFARRAGMRYIVITTKHHDGFSLFHSQVSAFNAVDASPAGRDFIRELANACHAAGMPLGFYYSQSQDWTHPGGAVVRDEYWDEAQRGDFDAYLSEIAEPQVRELLTNYGPVALIWFDTPVHMSDERATRFVNLVRELQPNCLINGRLREDRAGFDYSSMRDNQAPDRGAGHAWETPATLNDTWGYKANDHNWKSADTVSFKLVDIVSKGGNYLLNIGPRADGSVPEASAEILTKVGDWLLPRGEAIYGAGPTPYGEELSGSGYFETDKHWKYREPQGWRCTTQPGAYYFFLFGDHGAEFSTPGLPGAVVSVDLLTDAGPVALALSAADSGVRFRLPSEGRSVLGDVIRVRFRE